MSRFAVVEVVRNTWFGAPVDVRSISTLILCWVR